MDLRANATSAEIEEAVAGTWYLPRDEALAVLAACHAQLEAWSDDALDDKAVIALIGIARRTDVFHGPHDTVVRALTRAEWWADANGHTELLCRTYSTRGAALRDDLELPQSLHWLGRALALAQGAGLALAETSVWVQLGTRLGDAGLAGEAVRCYERALRLTQGQSGLQWTHQWQIATNNLAWSCVLLGRHAQALAHLDDYFNRIAAPGAAPPNLRTSAIAAENRARALLGLGRLDEARRAVDEAQALAQDSGDGRAQCAVQLGLGLIHVARGDSEAGFDVLQRALERCRTEYPPIVHAALETAAEAYERAGQHDVSRMYLHELYTLKRHAQAHVLARLQSDLAQLGAPLAGDAAMTPLMKEVSHSAPAVEAGLARERLVQLNRLAEEHAIAAERLDDTTGKHCYRVGRMAALLGRAVGLADDVCFMLDLAARLHDVGKLAVPEHILMKPGRLTDAEREVMQNHTVAGWELLSQSNIPQMHVAQEIARHHHEWWDGSGYPDGLAGVRIPISARVSALADVFDALTHRRPYKDAWSIDETLGELQRLKGRQFDPDLTEVFLALVRQLRLAHGDALDAVLAEAAGDSAFVRERELLEVALAAGNGT